jgi:type II secretion system protein H
MLRTSQKIPAGFTLIELLLVLTLITTLTAIAVPSLGKSVRHLAKKSAAEELAEVVRFGRAEAVRRGRPLRLIYVPETNAYRLEAQQAGLALEAGFEVIEDALFAQYTPLPTGVALEIPAAPHDASSMTVVFPASGVMEPVDLLMRDGEDELVVRLGAWIDEVAVLSQAAAEKGAA